MIVMIEKMRMGGFNLCLEPMWDKEKDVLLRKRREEIREVWNRYGGVGGRD